MDDRLARSNSDSDYGSDAGSEVSGDCATPGCPAFLGEWRGHRCVTCGKEFCVDCAYRCYHDCPFGITSGCHFCDRCLGEHEFFVHSRVRDDGSGGPGTPASAPTTAPPSEAAPESDAPDTVFGDEETPGVGGTAPNPTEGEPRDGDTGGTGSVDKEVCQPCSPQPSKCPGTCMGFLDGRCDQPCSRTKEGHNHCVCEYHDLELAVAEAAEAASG